VVVIVPVDRQIDEAHDIRHKARGHAHEGRHIGTVRYPQLQHHDGDQDGDDAITERSKTIFSHRVVLAGLSRGIQVPPHITRSYTRFLSYGR
jgi:hypothetical protein